jgi:PRTRC genetic system protein A
LSAMILHKMVTGPLGPIEARMMEYLWAGNGLFVRAQRKGLVGLVPIHLCKTQGLADVEPYVRIEYPKVPEDIVTEMFRLAKAASDTHGNPIEILFRLWWEEGNREWRLEVPKQEQYEAFCKPVSEEPPNTILEIHSHHQMEARFSGQDNRDEKGFRLYGVMGEFTHEPVIRMRLGIFGHYWELPASKFLNLPEGLKDTEDDCLPMEWLWTDEMEGEQ